MGESLGKCSWQVNSNFSINSLFCRLVPCELSSASTLSAKQFARRLESNFTVNLSSKWTLIFSVRQSNYEAIKWPEYRVGVITFVKE